MEKGNKLVANGMKHKFHVSYQSYGGKIAVNHRPE